MRIASAGYDPNGPSRLDGFHPGGTREIRTAAAARADLPSRPSFAYTFERWRSTVRGLTTRAAPISAFVRPCVEPMDISAKLPEGVPVR